MFHQRRTCSMLMRRFEEERLVQQSRTGTSTSQKANSLLDRRSAYRGVCERSQATTCLREAAPAKTGNATGGHFPTLPPSKQPFQDDYVQAIIDLQIDECGSTATTIESQGLCPSRPIPHTTRSRVHRELRQTKEESFQSDTDPPLA